MSPAHTDREYEQELRRLHDRLADMGQAVCGMLADCVRAFERDDAALAAETMRRDRNVDRMEVEIDELCLSILARRQPMGSDLRFVTTALKLVTDLERIADLCVNVCERTQELGGEQRLGEIPDLAKMAGVLQDMVRRSLEAVLSSDVAAGKAVIEQDALVDALLAQVFRQLLTRMAADPSQVGTATRLLSIAKYFERMGDHATNLAEKAIFMVGGEDVRHISAFRLEKGRTIRGVLFLCVHNSARSQMAEGLARSLLPPDTAVWSAGSDPASQVHPRAIEVMRELALDIAGQRPKRISEVPLDQINTVIHLCAEEICVTLPGIERTETWALSDPAATDAEPDEQIAAFRRVRDELHRRIRVLAAEATGAS